MRDDCALHAMSAQVRMFHKSRCEKTPGNNQRKPSVPNKDRNTAEIWETSLATTARLQPQRQYPSPKTSGQTACGLGGWTRRHSIHTKSEKAGVRFDVISHCTKQNIPMDLCMPCPHTSIKPELSKRDCHVPARVGAHRFAPKPWQFRAVCEAEQVQVLLASHPARKRTTPLDPPHGSVPGPAKSTISSARGWVPEPQVMSSWSVNWMEFRPALMPAWYKSLK